MAEKKIKCRFCGKEFISTRDKQKYCSARCSNAGLVRLAKPVERKCAWCGKVFTTDMRNKKYCSAACRNESDNDRSKQWYRKKSKGTTCVCRFCGDEFIREKKNQIYCTDECAKRADSVKQNERYKKPPMVSNKRKHNGKTDWKAIAKVCRRYKVSYGKAEAMGLLEGL